MRVTHNFHRWLIVVMALALAASLVRAQIGASQSENQQRRAQTTAWVVSYLRYLGLEGKASSQEVDQLTELKLKAEAAELRTDAREAAYRELFTQVIRLMGVAPAKNEQTITNWSQNARNLSNPDARVQAINSTTTPLGQLGHVEQMGRGPVTLILIPENGTDWTIYREFMERHADRYTMYAITLPGCGGTPPPPRPAIRDFSKTVWWINAEQAVLKLIEEKRLAKPVVVGTMAGAYLAARLALDHPDKVRAAVLLNGLVNSPMQSNEPPFKPASLAERQRRVNQRVADVLMDWAPNFPASTKEGLERGLQNARPAVLNGMLYNTQDLEKAKTLYLNTNTGSTPRTIQSYWSELQSADLTGDLKTLKAPLLVIPSIHDDKSAYQRRVAVSQWEEIKLMYPGIPITIAPFADTRAYVVLDSPAELGQALDDFLAGRPVAGKPKKITVARVSPRASVMQAIGDMAVTITYGRPALRGRKITDFVQKSPQPQVWRTGADEATTISFSADVRVEGQRLAAGTYSLFTIPAQSEWTIIFNKVVTQWGAFNYDDDFDALRIKVKPQEAEHQEWLGFSFETLSPTAAQAALRFGTTKVPFKIEIDSAKGS